MEVIKIRIRGTNNSIGIMPPRGIMTGAEELTCREVQKMTRILSVHVPLLLAVMKIKVAVLDRPIYR
jgi:hypothetical protein